MLTIPSCVQKGKGKAAASAQTPQPKLLIQGMLEDGEMPDDDANAPDSLIEQEIAATSQLLESFNSHATLWEGLEVFQALST